MKPKTLRDAILYFSNPNNCLDYLNYMANKRWPVVTCPTCGRKDVTYLATRRNANGRSNFSNSPCVSVTGSEDS